MNNERGAWHSQKPRNTHAPPATRTSSRVLRWIAKKHIIRQLNVPPGIGTDTIVMMAG